MDVFSLRDSVVGDYGRYVRSFLTIKDERIRRLVQDEMDRGFLWPEPLIQLNPSFEPGETFQQLIDGGELHPECSNIFRDKREDGTVGPPFRLYRHQVDGIRAARAGDSYVLTTGTGSGKSLSYIVPIVDHVLRRGSGKGIQAIIVYPMNALANSQMGELEKFLCRGYPAGRSPVTFQRYTGQESDEERKETIAQPPDILLTNYVMLELVLTRPWDYQLIEAAKALRFLVLDELHTYRGRQGADIAMLVRRVRAACQAQDLLHVGTSATLAGSGTWAEQQVDVAAGASRLFGIDLKPERLIGETPRRATPADDPSDPSFINRLRVRLQSDTEPAHGDTAAFLSDPLSSWIESTFGLREEPNSGRLLRCTPRSIGGDDGAAAVLAELTGLQRELCEAKIRRALLSGYLYRDENDHPLFAFRLHQFLSKGESVYASPEPEGARYATLQAQRFVPGSGRTKVLLPVAFCRECGQEYYSVRRGKNEAGLPTYLERSVSDRLGNDNACRRWRGLYLAALNQSKRQQRFILDPSRDPRDRESAKRLRAEAEAQLRLLLETSASTHSDFYSYRYFASEGFLPGYNFPRLPLSAFLPGRRQKKALDEFLTRPRFLAISEFGPRSIIYHEGSRYVINKVILPVEGDDNSTSIKRRAIQCNGCGYIHPLEDEPGPDLCESCGARLPPAYDNLFRMQNVATRRRDRINSDEEERLRLGYELKTGIRFARRAGVVSARHAEVVGEDGETLASLVYGQAATLWRMNLGWRRRKTKDQTGYILDIERGYWAKSQVVADDPDDPLSPRLERVIPYVEDTRNCILVRPTGHLSTAQMASLEAALKIAIQVQFQLEDRELATEALPSSEDRRQVLLYEASEGGAGVLRRLVEDPDTLPAVARLALEIAHFDPNTGQDQHCAKGSRDDCEAACYDCLLSYYNQRDHRLLDRHLLPDILRTWMHAVVRTSPVSVPGDDQRNRLLNLCQSELERRWLRLVDQLELKLPSDCQRFIESCGVRPDFLYCDEGTAIFIDGPPHDTTAQQAKDDEQQAVTTMMRMPRTARSSP